MVLVFDMDDTLFDELSYVRSGFNAVAVMLAPICARPAEKLLKEMMATLQTKGRGRVFDDLLTGHGCFTRTLAKQCVDVYRRHRPKISLWPEAKACLKRHAAHPVYVVTDGHKVVQQTKATALGLPRLTKRVLITHRFGRRHAKPSPYCFQRIAEWERVRPDGIVYIGDNPAKDFVGIRALGFSTIRVRTGQHATVEAKRGYDAERNVASLAEIDFTK
jgi:putative hydrolase of the HAD superfamily